MHTSSSLDNNSALTPSTPRFRRQILIHAQQLMQRLDDVEDQIEHFTNEDLPRYNSWFEAGFQPEREVIARLERELAAAVQFHNSVVAVSKLTNSSLSHAFAAMKQEQLDYINGSEARRARIEDERKAREYYIRQDLENEVQNRLAMPIAAEPQDAASDNEQMKLVYRKLVRRLHPDMNGAQTDATEARWQKRIWHLSQTARAAGDVKQLDALFKVSLLRQMELSELTIADAHEVHGWLKAELSRLESELNEMRAQPAWDFARAGESAALVQRVLSDFERERDFLESEIRELKNQHTYLEALSESEQALLAQMKRRRPRPKSEPSGDRQLSLFAD